MKIKNVNVCLLRNNNIILPLERSPMYRDPTNTNKLKFYKMAVKIRLARHGRKAKPFYHIVIADGRAPRDGRYIEKVGTYNPNTNPATINLIFDKALDWLNKGAQPTDTVRNILSYKGVMYKKHLQGGVKKGALTEEQAEVKFQAWLTEKEAKIQAKVEGLDKNAEIAENKRLENETKIKETRSEAIAKVKADAAAAAAAAAAPAEEATEEAPAEEAKGDEAEA